MKNTYTKKQITEAIAYWKKQLRQLNEDAHDGSGRDEYGFAPEETDVFLFDVVDETGSMRNGNYSHYAVSTDGTIPENEVKRRLNDMAYVWTQNSLRNARKEARKEHRQLHPYEIQLNTFKIANVQHMTKQQYIEDDSIDEIRFFDLDD